MSFSGIPARIVADIGTTGGLALDSSIVSVLSSVDSMSAKLPSALGRQSAGASLSTAMAMEDRTTSLAILADLDKFSFVATRLQVDAVVSSDIQIGAVEIKNATTDDRAVVRTDGVEMALVVSQNSQPLPTGAATSANQGTAITAIGAMSAKLPAALGAHPSATSLSVVVASDQVVPVSATSLPLPTGASTAANQATANGSLGSIDGKLNSLGQKAMTGSMPVVIASDQTPVAISAASLPLPVGAATSANQGTQITSLTSIDGKLTGVALDSSLQSILTDLNKMTFAATRLLVDGSGVTQPVSAASLPLPAGAATSANQATANTSLTSIDGKTPTLGQKAMAGSSPIVIASDQSAVPISAASLPLPAGAATSAKQPALGAAGTPSADVITVQGAASGTAIPISAASLPLPTGAATAANQATASASLSSIDGKLVTTANGLKVDGSAVTQPVSAAALPLPAGASTSALQTSGNASLTSIDGKLNSLGQKAMAASVPVVMASDQSGVQVRGTAAVGATPTNPPVSVSGVDGSGFKRALLTDAGGKLEIDSISGTISLPTGAATSANQATASASLTSIDGKTPALGQAAMAASTPVAIASNQPAIKITPEDGQKATYSAQVTGLSAALLATDIFTISGSATKTVRVTRVDVSGTQTTTGTADVLLIKRSALDTGGTATNPTKVAHDTLNSAATAVVSAYTANPTLGTAIGTMLSRKVGIDQPSPGGSSIPVHFAEIFSARRPAQAIVLRGAAEQLAVNLNGVTFVGNSFDVTIEWTEE